MIRFILILLLALTLPSIGFAQIDWIQHTIDDNFNGAWNVYAVDLDRDEDVDVLGASFYGDEITWWENNEGQDFVEHTIDGFFDGSIAVYAIDMDLDEDIDVLGAAFYGDEIAWWENDGDENFTKHVIEVNYDGSHDVYAIDMDLDGDIDILGASDLAGDVSWWENDGYQDFTRHVITEGFYGVRSVTATDLDLDGDIDVVGGAADQGDINWWENDGNQNFLERTIEENYNGFWVLTIDLDNDEDIDIVGAAAEHDDVSWWENDGNESFTRHIIDDDFGGPQAVYPDDLDGDGDIDVLGAARYTDELAWWENDGNLNFFKHLIREQYDYATCVFSIDLDIDGDVDVLGTAFGADNISWWEQVDGVVPEVVLAIADVYGENGQPVDVPIIAYGLESQEIAGVEFHINYDDVCLEYGDVSSDYLTDMLVNVIDGEIHILWEDYLNPVMIPDSAAVLNLQFTVLGQLGDTCPVEWTDNNELVDPLGEVIEDLTFVDGSVNVVEFHDISGNVVYYNLTTPVPNVTVELTGDYSASDITDENGAYSFEDLFPGDFTICPLRSDDDPGVTVTDIVLIRRHIVWLELFDIPYKLMAADVNESGNVSVADVIKMRRYLAELEELPSGNWTFVDSSFAITDENWPDAPECIDVTLWDADLTDSSFVGVRMGDVDYSWAQGRLGMPPPKVTDTAVLDLMDCYGQPGDTVQMSINVAGFTAVAGLELHIEFPPEGMSYIEFDSDVMPDPTTNGIDGEIHFVWEDIFNIVSLEDGEEVVSVAFEISEDAPDSMLVSFTTAYVVDEEGIDFEVDSRDGYILRHQTPNYDDDMALPESYRLNQNYPNPFNARTVIEFDLPEASYVRIEIYDLLGRQVVTLVNDLREAGYHQITWNAGDQPSGIYFYKIQANDFADAKKMLLLK